MLGGGSEARVYLCKLKDFDDLVALNIVNMGCLVARGLYERILEFVG